MRSGNRMQHDNKPSLPKAYDVEAREREERKRKRREGEEGREELDSFPVMMSFKAFLETQDDSITDEEALVKYGEYKMEFKRQKLNEFFVSHKTQEWFRTKYHPQESETRSRKEQEVSRRRCEIFQELAEKGFLEGVSCDQEKEVEIVKLLDSVVILLEGGNYEDIKNLDLEQNNNDHVKHKSSSIFIKNLHPSITRADVIDLVQKYPGFLRLAISDADDKNSFSRRSWVSFQRNAKIREICFAMNNAQLKGLELQAVVNKDLSRRIWTCNAKLNADKVLEKDLKIAMDIIKFQDSKRGLFAPKPTKAPEPAPANEDTDIKTEKLEKDAAEKPPVSAETPASSSPANPGNPFVEEAERVRGSTSELAGEEKEAERKAVLDKLVLYLRIVHSIDFYSQKDYTGEDDMPNKCGLMHVRSIKKDDLDETEVEKILNKREDAFKPFLTVSKKVEDNEARKLGLKDEEFELEKFISANSQELAKDKWLCTLSGKKFKAIEFVKKHIVNKFVDKVADVKTEVEFFNKYILDPSRPQIPEEKPRHTVSAAAPPVKKLRADVEGAAASALPAKKTIHSRLGVREQVTPARTGVRVSYANTDPRGLIDYSDIDSSLFDVFG